MMTWLEIAALAAAWFWAGYTWGAGRVRKRTKTAVRFVARVEREWSRLYRNLQFVGPGTIGRYEIPVEKPGADFKIILEVRKPYPAHERAK